jgi:hypothetical protein
MELARSMIENLRAREELHAHCGGGGGDGISDPMATVDSRMDAELAIQRGRLDEATRTLDEAWGYIRNIEHMLGGYYAQIISCHWLWLMTWEEVGKVAHFDRDKCRKDAAWVMDTIDGIGFAHLKDETGIAEI